MAESYRGLTIRIGGDTTKLSAALKTANAAIGQTQQELRKLNQAVRLDPGDFSLVQTQMSYMGQQATNTAAKIAQLQDSLKKLGEESMGGGLEDFDDGETLREYAEGVKNASMELATATSTANAASKSLAELHTSMSELSSTMASMEGDKLKAALDISQGKKTLEEYSEELKKTMSSMKDSLGLDDKGVESAVNKVLDNVKELKDALKFDNGDINLSVVRSMFESLSESIRPAKSEIDNFISSTQNLSEKTHEAFANAKEEVAGFEQTMKDGLADADAKLTEANQAAGDEFASRVATEVAKFNLAVEKLNDEFDKSISKAKTDSEKDDLENDRIRQIELLAAKYDITISGIESRWQSAMSKNEAESEKTRTKVIADFNAQRDAATEAAEKAAKEYETQFNGMAESMSKLEGTHFSYDKENTNLKEIKNTLDDMVESFVLTRNEADDMYGEIERLVDVFSQADDSQKLALKVARYKDLEVEIQKNVAALHNMSDVMTDMTMPSEVVGNLKQLTENIKTLESAYESLMNSGGSLSSVFDANPSNMKALEESVKAYASAEQVALENAQRLSQELASFDADKINEASDGSKSAAQQLYDASNAAEDAKNNLAEVEGQIAHWESRQEELNATLDKTKDALKDDANAKTQAKQLAEDLVEAKANLATYSAMLPQVTAEEKKASEALELAKQRKELEDVTRDVAAWSASIENARKKLIAIRDEKAVLEVVGDTSNIDRLGEQLDAAVARANLLKTALELNPTNVDLAKAKIEAFSEVTRLAGMHTDAINDAMSRIDTSKLDAMREQYGSVSNAVVQTEQAELKLKSAIDDTKAELTKLTESSDFDDIRADILDTSSDFSGKLDPSVETVRNRLIALESALQDVLEEHGTAKLLQSFEGLGNTLTETTNKVRGLNDVFNNMTDVAAVQMFEQLAQYAERAGRAIVESANTIDAAYRDMRKTVQTSEAEFVALKDAAIDFSQTHAVSSDTILEIESLGGQLGLAASSLQEFGETISNLDIATDLDADELALKMGQLQNVMDDFDPSNFDNAADAVVRLGNNMAAQESSILAVAQRMSSVANVANMTTSDLFAWSAAIASTGQRSESAATAIANTMTGIASAVAAGGKDLEGFASIANMSADEFSNAWKTNPTDALKAFIKGLESMSDSNTEAIASLEAMGISSVRQENALLALASTVNTLDDALEMSQDAWNGIGDDFGQAGDAAREAQNKSEGFSGSLSILQNNASNLAASLGDGIIPMMNAAASLFSVVTDVINGMPEPVKQVATEFGVLVIAVGLLNTALKGLGTEQTVASLVSLVAAEGAATVASGALAAALEAIPGVAAIAALVAAVQYLAGCLVDAYEDAHLLSEATDGLRNNIEHMNDAFEGTSVATQSLKEMREETNQTLQSVADFGEKMNETWGDVGTDVAMAEKYAETIKTLGNQGSITKSELAELKNAVSQYNEITGASVSIVSEMTGKLSLNGDAIDEVTAAYRRQAEAQAYIELYNEAVKQKIENDQKLKQAEADLEEAEKTWGLRIGDTGILIGQQMDKYRELQRRVESYKSTQSSLDDVITEYSGHLDDAAYEFTNLDAAMTSAGVSASQMAGLTDDEKTKLVEVESALEENGDALRNYGTLTSQQLAQIAAAWNGSYKSISNLLKSLSSEMSGSSSASSIAAPSDEDVTAYKRNQDAIYTDQKNAYDQQYTELKRNLDAEYTALKRALDAEYDAQKDAYDDEYDALKSALDKEYDAQKDAYDDEYDALKSALDKEYNAQKSTYDKEYNAQKSAYDKQYNARKSELDKAYNAQKSALDKEYNARKAAYDKQYNALKSKLDKEYSAQKSAYDKAYKEYKKQLDKEYDARKDALDDNLDALKDANDAEEAALKKANDAKYNALKKQLDKEYSAYKKANDKVLSALKKQQSAETKAFKAETTARIALIKQEYEARKKAIEDVDGTSGIDERIKSIQAQTKAEQEANKLREQEQKKADLQLAVDQAKTRKTRQEAEEALAEYLAELAQEAREAEREAEIERLEERKDAIKEETKAKQEALDEERDAVIAAYEEQRDLELEALDESQSAVYDAQKEALDAQNELYKEKLDERLAAYKEQLDANLNALKEANDAEEQALKDKNDADLERIKETQEQQLEAYKEANEVKLAAIKEAQTAELEAQKTANSDALAVVKQNHSDQLTALKEAQSAELTSYKESNDEKLNTLKTYHSDQLATLKEAQAAELAALKDAQDADLEAIKDSHDAQLDELKDWQDRELTNLKNGYDDQLTALKNYHDDVLTNQKNWASTQLTNLKNSQSDQLAAYKSGLTDVNNTVKSKGDEIAETSDQKSKLFALKMAEGIAPVPAQYRERFHEIISNAEEQLKRGEDVVWLGGKNVGENAVDGVKTGLQKKADELGVTTKTLMDEKLLGEADKALDSNSPSREMERRGQYAVEGFIDGLRSGEDDVSRKSYDIARSATEGVDDIDGRSLGESVADSFANGIESQSYKVGRAGSSLARDAEDGLSGADAYWAGYNFVSGFESGMNGVDLWWAAYDIGMNALDAIRWALGIHSPSKEAEIVGQFFMRGLEMGIEEGERSVERSMESVADLMTEGVDGVVDGASMGVSVADGIIDGLKSRENALAEQVRRMSQIVEDGFDPRTTVDAAFEAISSIRSGELARAAQSMQVAQSTQNQTVNINVTLSDVTIREEADIKRLAKELSAYITRAEASRLGR